MGCSIVASVAERQTSGACRSVRVSGALILLWILVNRSRPGTVKIPNIHYISRIQGRISDIVSFVSTQCISTSLNGIYLIFGLFSGWCWAIMAAFLIQSMDWPWTPKSGLRSLWFHGCWRISKSPYLHLTSHLHPILSVFSLLLTSTTRLHTSAGQQGMSYSRTLPAIRKSSRTTKPTTGQSHTTSSTSPHD